MFAATPVLGTPDSMMIQRPRSVLYLDNSSTFGGAINALEHLLKVADRTRLSPVVVSAQDESILRKQFPEFITYHWNAHLPWVDDRFDHVVRGLPLMRLRLFHTLWGLGRGLWWIAFRYLPDALWLAEIGRRHKVELIHLNNGVEGLLPGLLAGKLLRVPVLSHARGPQGTTERATRLMVREVTHHIAVSGWIADNLYAAGARPGTVTVVHDGIDVDAFAPGPPASGLKRELGIPESAHVFGTFGRVVDWKGTKEFIMAAARVLRERANVYGLIVGDASDGSEQYYREAIALRDSLGLQDRLLFTGYRGDLADLMRLCDVVVHSSIVPEPFGMIVIEGMATQRPVVAAASGGPLEVVVRGETGLLVDPSDAQALSDAILELLRNPARAAEMGRHAAERVRTHFTAQRVADEVLALYDRVLSVPAAQRGAAR